MEKEVKIDRDTFKQIFRDHWVEFKSQDPRYSDPYYEEIISKMLGCGDLVSGYSVHKCIDCWLEEKTVPFSCKSSFCLSCAKVYVDEWVSHISEVLRPGLYYRHVVLTVPKDLHLYFYRNAELLLPELMKCGVRCLEDVLRVVRRQKLKGGYIVVLQTGGRSGRYNPHLHIIMTDGGISEETGKWVDLGKFPYEILHKKWQYHLLEMLREVLFTEEIDEVVDQMWEKYPKGFVAHIKGERVPAGGESLARYLAKYVVSPPISVRRITKYDGKEVTYWYRDHKTDKKEIETVPVLTFIGRMVQHILPKGFQRVRYYGLQATKTFDKLKELISKALLRIGRVVRGTYRKIVRKKYGERYHDGCGKDPFICSRCGAEMVLWKIWHPKYGVIYDELEEMKRGKYGAREREEERKAGDNPRRVGDNGGARVLQLSLQFLWT